MRQNLCRPYNETLPFDPTIRANGHRSINSSSPLHMASRRQVMGEFALKPWLKVLGWVATAVMAAAAVGMFATWNG